MLEAAKTKASKPLFGVITAFNPFFKPVFNKRRRRGGHPPFSIPPESLRASPIPPRG
jgi:hypothetical protein